MLNAAIFQNAIRDIQTETGERAAMQRVLDREGYRRLPVTTMGTLPDGRRARVHLWRDVWPNGVTLALVSGPDVEGRVLLLYPHSAGDPVGDIYIPAGARSPALTTLVGPGQRGAPRSVHVNPDGGSREVAGASSSLAQIQKAVHAAQSEQAQVNLVARVLAGQGYAAAGKPEVHATTVDRSTFRIYLWRDTPFGDHLVLSTGPSFEPKVALASQIPAEPGVGFYVKALVDRHPEGGVKRVLAGAGRAAARAMPKPTVAAEAAAERVARKVRAPKARVLEAATQIAEAEDAPTVTVAHVEQVATPAVDEAAAMREAADFIKALRAMRGAG